MLGVRKFKMPSHKRCIVFIANTFKASSTLEATRDTRRKEMGPVPFLHLLHHALLGVCNMNRTVVTTRSCAS